MGGARRNMPQGKSAQVKNLASKSAIQKKKTNNAKLKAKKAKVKAKIGGVLSADNKSKLLSQRGKDQDSMQVTKMIQKRISDDVHSRAAKQGSGFGVVKSSDFEKR